jgi:transcriptional accessory protein Tex/SPT6
MSHAQKIASLLKVKPSQVAAVIQLLDEGNTVPVHLPLPQGDDRLFG